MGLRSRRRSTAAIARAVLAALAAYGPACAGGGRKAPTAEPPPLPWSALPPPPLAGVSWDLPRLVSVHDARAARMLPLRPGSVAFAPIEPVAPGTSTLGDCDPLLVRLGEVQEHYVTVLDPVFAGVAEDLARAFGRAWPDARFPTCPALEKMRSSCLQGEFLDCPVAPRLVVRDDVSIAVPDLDSFMVLSRCEDVPVLEALQEVARSTARTHARVLRTGTWSDLAARLAALTILADALADACVPRRRRTPPSVYGEIEHRLAEIDDLLAVEPAGRRSGRFEASGGALHVPGSGRFLRVMRWVPEPVAPSFAVAEAAGEIAVLVRDGPRCRVDDLHTVWGLPDETGELLPVYPESFVCDGLAADRRLWTHARP